MTLRSLLRGSLLYTLGNFLPRVGAFLLLPVYTAAMSPGDFGVFSLMISVSGLLAIVYRLGLDGAVMRLHFDLDHRARPRLYVTSAAATLVVAAVVSGVLVIVGGQLFERLFAGVAFWPFGALTIALTALTAFQYLPAVLYRATERPGRFLAFTAGTFAVGVVATLILLLGFDLGAAGALLGQIAGATVMALVALQIVARLQPAAPDPRVLGSALRFGLPLLPHALAGWVLNLSDRWLIGLLIGGTAAAAQASIGIYSFGYVLGQVVGLVALSFNAAWVPFFYARGERPAGPALLREMSTLTTGGLAVLAVLIGALAPELTQLLAGDRWGPAAADAADVVPIVAVASLAYGLYFMVVSVVFLTRRTGALPLLTLGAATANVAVNLVLIPRIGVVGAAWATLAGYTALAAATFLYARRGFDLRLDAARLAALLGAAVAALVVARLVDPERLGMVGSGLIHLGIALVFAALAWWVVATPVERLRKLVAELGPIPSAIMAPPKEVA